MIIYEKPGDISYRRKKKEMMTATVLVFLNQIKTQKVKRSANFN